MPVERKAFEMVEQWLSVARERLEAPFPKQTVPSTLSQPSWQARLVFPHLYNGLEVFAAHAGHKVLNSEGLELLM